MAMVKVYRIISSGPYLAIAGEDGRILTEGMDIRNEKEALNVLSDMAREEGMQLNPIRDEQGHLDRVEATVNPAELRFTIDSLRLVDQIKSRVAEALRRHAAKRTAEQGRRQVTDKDIRESLNDAVADVTRDVTRNIAGN